MATENNAVPQKEAPESLPQKLHWYVSLLLVLVILFGSPLGCGLFYLSQVPDAVWGEGQLEYDRIWMARGRRPVGIGYETQRVVEEYNEAELCVEHRITFFLWGEMAEAEPATFRRVMALVDGQWQPTGEACTPKR
jgi:hypothetical protein